MKNIPSIIQTKQDVLNLHRMAMNNVIDRKLWKIYLNQVTQPNKYVFPILRVEKDCFYIPYTDLPIHKVYKNIFKVSSFNEKNNLIQIDNRQIPSNDIKIELVSNSNYHLPDIINSAEDKYTMLQIFSSINPSNNQMVVYYGCPFYTMTGMTPEDISKLLKEMI